MPALIGAAFLVAAAVVYGWGTVSAAMPRWIVLYGWASVAVVVCVVQLWRGKVRLDRIDGLALSLLAWMALSISWSEDWRQGVFQFTNSASLCAIFLWARRYPALLPEAAMVAIAASLLLQFNAPQDWGGHGNMNFQSETLLVLMGLAAMSRFKWTAAVFIGVAASYLPFNPSKVEWFVLLSIAGLYAVRLYRLHTRKV